MTGKNKHLISAFILLLILLLSFFMRFISFSRTPYAVGRDVYFHIIQARSLLEEGKTHAPDSSLTPPLMVVSYLITGDWEIAPKFLSSVLCLLYSLFAYLAARQLFSDKGNKKEEWALMLTAVLTVSPGLSYIAAQFLKQMLGMTSFMLFIWLMLWNINQDKKHRESKEPLLRQILRRGIMLGAVLLTLFSHRLSGVMALIGMAFALPWIWLALGAGIGVIALVAGTLLLPGILSVLDLERLSGVFQPLLSFHPAVLSHNLSVNAGWMVEMIWPYLTILLIIAGAVLKKIRWSDRFLWYMLVLLILAVFPFYKMNDLDFGFRVFIAIIPFVPILIFHILVNLVEDLKIPEIAGMVATGFYSLLLIPFSYLTFLPEKMLPYAQYQPVIEKTEKIFARVHPEMVIVHHGFSFYYTFISRRHTLPFLVDWDVPADRIYRIAFNIPEEKMVKYLAHPAMPPIKLDQEYTLFREDDWNTLLQNSTNDAQMQFRMKNGKNPFQKRPGFLARFQKHDES